ncbi:MAG: family lipase [Sphingobacteriaceae bacterium]|jgi:lysophospholipase L1-like esterase|nr:family lipase [Sphingobacteriaceae bacterium]
MKKQLFSLALLFIAVTSFAQTQHRYWDDIQTIKKFDKLYSPPANPILFVGSSSIRKWDYVQRAFGEYDVMNRGIGGAITDDITFYLNDIVFPYKPRQIVLFVGENDVPSASTPDSILAKTKRLFSAIRTKLPGIPIVYISIKPSPSRDKFMDKAKETNKLIRQYLSTDKNTVFVDVYSLMLTPEGKSRPELFGSDMLHMNKAGYAIWEKAVRPYLLKRTD